MKLLVCGEALLDVFHAGAARVGGSPFNVAVGLARLGQPVAFFGGISRGDAGQRILSALQAEGVDTAAVALVDAPTTLSIVDSDEHGVPSYAFHGDGCADREVTPADLVSVPAGPDILHVGSYAMVVEPVASTLRALVERERGGGLVAYDPNVRLRVEPDAQRWRGTVEWMLERADLVKASEEDLEALWPGEDPLRIASSWVERGPQLVVVTRGARGAFACTRRARLSAPSPTTNVVDTVGAGDAFQAALLHWLATRGKLAADALAGLEGDELVSALTFCNRAASVTCSRQGADLPRIDEL